MITSSLINHFCYINIVTLLSIFKIYNLYCSFIIVSLIVTLVTMASHFVVNCYCGIWWYCLSLVWRSSSRDGCNFCYCL